MAHGLDHESPIPLYHQLAEALRYKIATGVIGAGATLPPLRQAAESWGVNLHTVRRAYEKLAVAGLVETRAPFGTRVMPRRAPRRSDGLRAFLARVRREARDAHGLAPPELARMLLRGTDGGAPAQRVHVVECSETQCRDLARQLEARWDVRAEPWSLGRGQPPPFGPVVVSYFHYNEARRLWPDRLADIQFAAIHPDPALLDDLDARRGGRDGRTVVVLCERESTMAANIAADLALILPRERYQISTRVVRRPAQALARRAADETLMFAPRMWGELTEDERSRPQVLEARYLFDAEDLERIGRSFGWAARRGERTEYAL